ncbi:MAG: glycosyltransferase [Acidimicrobiia bacterium]
MGGAPAITVVIPTCARPELLPVSVAAVLGQVTDVEFEVLVVNDDREPLRCLLPADPRLRVLTSGGRGVSAARNLGIREARAPVVAFTDDDTVAPPGWLAAAHRGLAADPDAIGVEGPVEYGRSVDWLHEHVPEPEIPGGFCSCNVAYRRKPLLAVGGFDERFPRPGGEDVDLGLRISELGPVRYEPDMVMIHPPRSASARELVRMARQVENDWYVQSRHPGAVGARSRFGGIRWRTRRYLAFAGDREVTEGSPARVARALVLGAGTAVVGLVTACSRPMPEERPPETRPPETRP